MDLVEELWVQEILARPFSLSRKGYAVLYVPDHPWAGEKTGQMYRSRYIMNVLGRLADRMMVVHHRDRDKLNDHPDNLEALPKSAHDAIHHGPLPEAQKEKIRQSLLGKKHTEQRRKNISEAHKGIPLSDEAKQKVSVAMRGRKITWADKISATHKAKGTLPPFELAWAACRGKPLTAEHKAQARAATVRRWAKARPALDQRAREWQELRSRGLTLKAIGQRYGVSAQRVCSVLTELRKL